MVSYGVRVKLEPPLNLPVLLGRRRVVRAALHLLVHRHQPRARHAAVSDALTPDAHVDEQVRRSLTRERTLERRRQLDSHGGQTVVEVGVALLPEHLALGAQSLARRLEAVQTDVEAHRRPGPHVPRLVQLQRVHLRVEVHRPLLPEVIQHRRNLRLGPNGSLVPVRLLDEFHRHQHPAAVRASLDVSRVHALRQLAHLREPLELHLARPAVERVPPRLLELLGVHDQLPETHRLARDVVIRPAQIVIHQRHLQRRQRREAALTGRDHQTHEHLLVPVRRSARLAPGSNGFGGSALELEVGVHSRAAEAVHSRQISAAVKLRLQQVSLRLDVIRRWGQAG
mmetsp:Transcript_8248/g.32550  ORF Transcript_8248/g.32550 Transcript_8248/m.32550 type:complete len:340 (-) Transcript_8248:841-1860(-)